MHTLLLIEPSEFHFSEMVRVVEKHKNRIVAVTNSKKVSGKLEGINYVPYTTSDELVDWIEHEGFEINSVYTFTESAIETCLAVSYKLGLSYECDNNALLFRDKLAMKSKWKRKNIKTPDFKAFESKADLIAGISDVKYPVVLKSNCSFSSNGVFRVSSNNEVARQSNVIELIHKSYIRDKRIRKQFLLEEYIEGEEYSVDSIWRNGQPITSIIMKKGLTKPPYFLDRLYYCIDNDSSIYSKVLDATTEAVLALGVQTAATHTEVLVKNDQMYVLESAYRPGASGLIYVVGNHQSGIDYFDILYRIVVLRDKSPMDQDLLIQKDQNRDYYFYYLPYEGAGKFDSVVGIDSIRQNKTFAEIYVLVQRGDYLPVEHLNGGNVCCALIGYIQKGESIYKWIEQHIGGLMVLFY